MRRRTVLYGYKYENGMIVVDPLNADIVKEIFSQYINGNSLLQISDLLNKLHIEYCPGVVGWNKSRVKRIIDDKRYIGNEEYPQIIDDDIAHKANEIKESRNRQKDTDRDKLIYQLNMPVVCPRCGSIMRRYSETRISIHERWRCQSSSCKTVIGISDETMIKEIINLLNTVISQPDIIKLSGEQDSVSTEASRIQNEINRMLDNGHENKDEIRTMIIKSASVKYDDLNTKKYKVIRLKDIFAYQQPVSEFPMELFKQTVSSISFEVDNTVTITLLNGQIIGKESKNGTAKKES